jgi:hypothetical protein
VFGPTAKERIHIYVVLAQINFLFFADANALLQEHAVTSHIRWSEEKKNMAHGS